MDDILLLDAVERYTKGEMSAQERTYFEDLRKNNAELDQLVVEHTFFLAELDKHAQTKAYKHTLHETEAKLAAEGVINKPNTGKGKVILLWRKYRRNIAVAASIAVLVSLATTGIVVTYNNQAKHDDKLELIRIMQQEVKNEVKKEVAVTTANQRPRSFVPDVQRFAGTGFIIDSKGYWVTNEHVINKMKDIYVENNKGEYFRVKTIYTDNVADLAILKIMDNDSFKLDKPIPYSLRKTNSDLGEQVFTLGFPRNDVVYGEGYLSAKSGKDGDSTAYQLSISANPGNSGGPLINKNGEVIGVITSKMTSADGVVYAAKTKNIFNMLESLKKSDDTQNIKLPTSNGLKGLERTQQVKKMEEFVFMVVGN